MKLSKIKLSNFKCFGERETVIEVNKNITTFVGTNSSGKSSIMEAILKLLSPNSSQRIIKKSDFHIPKEKIIEDFEKIDMYIELVFDFDELAKDNADYTAIPVHFSKMIVNNVGDIPKLRIRLESTWQKSNNPEGSIDTSINYINCAETDEVTDESKSPARRKDLDLIRAIYIPSTRDIEREIKFVSGTMMQRIFNLVNWDDETRRKIKEDSIKLNDEVRCNEQVKIIDESISKNWGKFNIDKKFQNAKIEFSSSEITEMLKKIEVGFNPTYENRNYLVSELGDGSRSLFYFSMVSSMIDIENKLKELDYNSEIDLPILTIVIAEEPENHIAPHLLGQLVNSLLQIPSNKSQVMITSHSPSIIERIDPENIRLVRNNNNYNTTVTSIKIPNNPLEAYKLIKETIRKHPQIYFSKMLILVEGDSEKYVLPKFLDAKNINLDLNSISIVTLDSRFVNKMWYVLNSLQIDCITFIDLDNERVCGGYKKLKEIINCMKEIKENFNLEYSDGKSIFDENIDKGLMKNPYDLNNVYIKELIKMLEKENVYFSNPIDFDFLLLNKYLSIYKETLRDNEKGPIIKNFGALKNITDLNRIVDSEEYKERQKRAISNTLKDDGGDGKSFSEEERNLMIWYDYFFLGKGKVNTHFKAFNDVDKELLLGSIPEVISDLILKIEDYINER